MTDKTQELLAAYAEYVELLEASEGALMSFAHTHGYECLEALVRRGQELRQRIAELKE